MDKQTTWDIYFAAIASMKFHPRNDAKYTDIEEAAEIADAMMKERDKRWPSPQE